MVLGARDNPPPGLSWAKYFFHSFALKILSTVYMRRARQLRWARQLGEASCLASAGRVTLAGETPFFACKKFASTTRDETAKS